MSDFLHGWGFTGAALALITIVFLIALVGLRREFTYIRALTDFLGYGLAHPEDDKHAPGASLLTELIRDEATAILSARDPAWADKQVRGWLMRTHRLEPALAFWVDFLRQLGLLFTVVGLGMSLAVPDGGVDDLLAPLGLAVWTTVAGLFFSVWLSAQFGMQMAVWADTCEKNIEAWNASRAARDRENEP